MFLTRVAAAVKMAIDRSIKEFWHKIYPLLWSRGDRHL